MTTYKIDLIFTEIVKAFNSEKSRYDKLSNKAEQYIAFIAIIIGFNLIDINRLNLDKNFKTISTISVFSVLAFILLVIGLIFSILAVRVMNYSSYPRGQVLIDELKSSDIDIDIAKIKLAKMYLTAFNQNAAINDKRANLLSWVSVFVVSGFISAVISHVN